LAGQKVETFRIGKYEVTWDEWKAVRDWAVANGYSDLANVGVGSADNHPVREVNWHDVVKWCNARSEMEGLMPVYTVNGTAYRSGQSVPEADGAANGYRLPREAEWEWAARGGLSSQGYTYSGSNNVDVVAWTYENSSGAVDDLYDGRGTWPVGQKAANELGIHDMSGNVWEWCEDLIHGSSRRLRGGAWGYYAGIAAVASRDHSDYPGDRDHDGGFRLARSVNMVHVQGGTLLSTNSINGSVVSSFEIGKYEVTWHEWLEVRTWAVNNGYMDLAHSGTGSAGNHPVRGVRYYQAAKWCNAKSEKDGLEPVYLVRGVVYKIGEDRWSPPVRNASANGYRLPTEAEWEWAARGGLSSQGYTYSGSNNVDVVAWTYENSSGAVDDLYDGRGTWPVGQKAANELGIHDMSGNVWEWVDERNHNYMMRGGGFEFTRPHVTLQIYPLPWNHTGDGFRLARNWKPVN
jgi:formylglycine-generating enzyme required for sulfatase activity